MSYTVNISEAAENDLRAVFTYIAVELRSYTNAAGQLARLEAAGRQQRRTRHRAGLEVR